MIEIKFSSPAPFHLVALIVRLNPFLTNKKSANFGLEVPPPSKKSRNMVCNTDSV